MKAKNESIKRNTMTKTLLEQYEAIGNKPGKQTTTWGRKWGFALACQSIHEELDSVYHEILDTYEKMLKARTKQVVEKAKQDGVL